MKKTLVVALAAVFGALATWLALERTEEPPGSAGAALSALPESPAAAAVEPPDPPTRQGISVRGEWTLEVRDPDGGVVSTTTFDNAYTDPANHLAELLTGQTSTGSMAISIGGDPAICKSGSAPAICTIAEAAAQIVLIPQVGNLTTAAGDKQISLDGHVIAQTDGKVATVGVRSLICPAAVAPADCLGAETAPRELTAHTLDTPIDVAEGQQIVAKVVLSFGAANQESP